MNHLKPVLIFLVVTVIISSCKKETGRNCIPVVNAGRDTIIELKKSGSDTIQLSGEATDKDGTIVSYLWSQVSGPNTATIVNPGSASTFAAGVISGTYVFQLMATDNHGATGVKSVSITVTASTTFNLTLQPYQNPNEVHIWGNDENLEGSHPGAPELGATSWTYQGDVVYQRGLVKFDLKTIPVNSTIKSARLTLFSDSTPSNGDLVHANSGSNNTMLIQRVTANWNPLEVKWKNQPVSTTGNQVVIPSTAEPYLDLIDVDVTSLVQSMVNSNSNFGFLIRLQNEVVYNSRIFYSSYNQIASKRPKLVVQYSK